MFWLGPPAPKVLGSGSKTHLKSTFWRHFEKGERCTGMCFTGLRVGDGGPDTVNGRGVARVQGEDQGRAQDTLCPKLNLRLSHTGKTPVLAPWTWKEAAHRDIWWLMHGIQVCAIEGDKPYRPCGLRGYALERGTSHRPR